MTAANISRELALFCDRTEEGAAIREYLSHLHQGNGHKHPLVNGNFPGAGTIAVMRLD